MKRKSIILLVSLFLSLSVVLHASAATLTVGSSTTFNKSVDYYIPAGGAPASVSVTLPGVATSGFAQGFNMSLLPAGWSINGLASFASSSDLAARDLTISGAPSAAPLTMTLRAISPDLTTSADATINLSFRGINASFDLSQSTVNVVQGQQTDSTIDITTVPANATFSELLLSDGTAPTTSVKWNDLTITANRTAKNISITGIPLRSLDKTIQVIASGDWGQMTRTFNITAQAGKVDLVLRTIFISDLKGDCASWSNPKTCTSHRVREYTDYGSYTNFNVGGSYYVVLISRTELPELIVSIKEPGSNTYTLLPKLSEKPPVIVGRQSQPAEGLILKSDGMVSTERGSANSTAGYYVTTLGNTPALIMQVGPRATGDYVFRINYTSNNFRDHTQDVVMRCTYSVNQGSTSSGCNTGIGLFVVGVTVLGSLMLVRRTR